MAPGQIEIRRKTSGFRRGKVSCCSKGICSQDQEAQEGGETLTHSLAQRPWPLAASVAGIVSASAGCWDVEGYSGEALPYRLQSSAFGFRGCT